MAAQAPSCNSGRRPGLEAYNAHGPGGRIGGVAGPLRRDRHRPRRGSNGSGRSGSSTSSDTRSRDLAILEPSDETDGGRAGPAGLSAPDPYRLSPSTSGGRLTITRHHSCFGAGTPFRTSMAPARSRRSAPATLVLTQNPKTGELRYQAIVAVYHNPPNATYPRRTGGAASRSSPPASTGSGRPGKGWTMARELKPGDVLRTLGGRGDGEVGRGGSRPAGVQPPGGRRRELLRGPTGVLAHDNSTIDPVPEPFDAVAPLSAASASHGRPATEVHARPLNRLMPPRSPNHALARPGLLGAGRGR